MLIRSKTERSIATSAVLFDAWYGSVANLKLIHRLDMIFLTTRKNNRMIALTKEQGYTHLSQLERVSNAIY